MNIQELKRLSPLPQVMEKLGVRAIEGKKMRCPFPGHEDKNPSFDISHKDGKWWFTCWSRCGSGDVIDFIAKLKGITKADAIKELKLMAGVTTRSCLHNSEVSPRENSVDVDTPKSRVVAPAPYTPPPLALLPRELQDYIRAAAESLNVDVSYILLPMLSSLGCAIGDTRSILLKRNFIMPPVIWTGIIGRSGSRKSPALEAGCFAAIRRERELTRQNKRNMEIWENEMAEWEAKDRKSRGVKPAVPMSLTCLMDNLTLEALADAIQGNPRGVLVKKDELSHWFASFDQYTNAKGSDVSQWLSLHSGVFFGLDRRSDNRRYRIHQPRVALTGGIQPQVLKRVLTEQFFEQGLPARFLFAHPPFQKDKWNSTEIPDNVRADVLDLFDALWELQPDRDEYNNPCPRLLRLSDDALDEYIRYYDECAEATAGADERGEAAWNKMSGYAARLALVGQLARDPHATIVTGETMQAACDLARWFGNEAVRIYATLSETKEQREQRKLVEFIESRGGVVTVRDIMQSFRPLKNERDNAEAALKALASAGIGKWEESQHTGAGRPGRKFRLSTVSTSTQFDDSRGKMDNSVDVDSSKNEKITPESALADGVDYGEAPRLLADLLKKCKAETANGLHPRGHPDCPWGDNWPENYYPNQYTTALDCLANDRNDEQAEGHLRDLVHKIEADAGRGTPLITGTDNNPLSIWIEGSYPPEVEAARLYVRELMVKEERAAYAQLIAG